MAAIDAANDAFFFWVAGDHLPYLAVSRDGGKTFGTTMMVAPPGVHEAMLPALAVGDTGRIAFSYLATTTSPGGPCCTRTKTSGCTTADGQPEKSAEAYATHRVRDPPLPNLRLGDAQLRSGNRPRQCRPACRPPTGTA